jgi:hypothetical protein
LTKPKVELTLCKGCKLPYDLAANPDGCPRCKSNPALALAAQANAARHDEERATRLAPGTARMLRIGAFAIGGVLAIVTTLIVMSQSEKHTTELGEGRRHLVERACAMSSVDPATVEMEQCINVVLNDCKDQSMSALSDCALAAAQRRYAVR